ncbi:VQ motif-containing protein 9-like [Euphorbia lathyris]|uniref:VQ motif-containing protein 9-like n=1 Tax=Euphorbia lathyris TaxID=212925 RepID=UPI00331406D0
MEAYSAHSSSSSSSSMYQSGRKTLKQLQSFISSSLHSVRKSNVNPSKKPIASLPPTPPRVYKVDPMNFRDLVQKLTGAAEESSIEEQSLPQQHRLQRVAPPLIDILDRQPSVLFNNSPVKTPSSALYRELMCDTPDQKSINISESVMAPGFLDLNLFSPSAWCSFPLLSPGTLSSLD